MHINAIHIKLIVINRPDFAVSHRIAIRGLCRKHCRSDSILFQLNLRIRPRCIICNLHLIVHELKHFFAVFCTNGFSRIFSIYINSTIRTVYKLFCIDTISCKGIDCLIIRIAQRYRSRFTARCSIQIRCDRKRMI